MSVQCMWETKLRALQAEKSSVFNSMERLATARYSSNYACVIDFDIRSHKLNTWGRHKCSVNNFLQFSTFVVAFHDTTKTSTATTTTTAPNKINSFNSSRRNVIILTVDKITLKRTHTDSHWAFTHTFHTYLAKYTFYAHTQRNLNPIIVADAKIMMV